jgi:hypothetical protein
MALGRAALPCHLSPSTLIRVFPKALLLASVSLLVLAQMLEGRKLGDDEFTSLPAPLGLLQPGTELLKGYAEQEDTESP